MDTALRHPYLISPDERALLLSWSSSDKNLCSECVLGLPTIHQYVSNVARELPDSIALHWWTGNPNDEIQLSYAELEENADRLARALILEQGVRSGDVVLIFFNKGIDMIIGILGIVSNFFSIDGNFSNFCLS